MTLEQIKVNGKPYNIVTKINNAEFEENSCYDEEINAETRDLTKEIKEANLNIEKYINNINIGDKNGTIS